MSNTTNNFPAVGTDATMAIGSDRYPYRVILSDPKNKIIGVVSYQETHNPSGSIYSGDYLQPAKSADGSPLLDEDVTYLKYMKHGFREVRFNEITQRWNSVGGGASCQRWSFGYAQSYRDPNF